MRSSDTMPFKFLAQQRELCQSATFVDMDYRQLILKKCEVIRATKQLHEVIADFEMPTNPKDVILKSEKYYALACDLQKIQDLDHALRKLVDPRDDVSILYIAEVSMTYMDATAANTLIKWASGFAPGRYQQCLMQEHQLTRYKDNSACLNNTCPTGPIIPLPARCSSTLSSSKVDSSLPKTIPLCNINTTVSPVVDGLR